MSEPSLLMRMRGGGRRGAAAAPVTRGRAGLWVIAALALMASYPQVASSFGVFLMASAMTYGLLAMSLDLQWGYAGLINFGPAAYFGLGAYGYGLLSSNVSGFGSAWAAVPAAVVITAAFAVLISYPAFRSRALPLYYALLTLAVALLLGEYATIADSLTGGSDGLVGIPPIDLSIDGLFTFTALSDIQAFYVVLASTTVVFALLLWVVSGPFGRAVRAIRADEDKCESLGYSAPRYKLTMAALGGAMGGLAGALYAGVNGQLDPSVFGVTLGLQAFVWVAIGGQGTLWGPLLAAVLLQLAESYFSSITADLYLIIIAAIFVVTVIVLPEGVAGGLRRLVKRTMATEGHRV